MFTDLLMETENINNLNNIPVEDITSLFNFNDITDSNNIKSKLLLNECFLTKILNLKKEGIIERDGDLFYGIKNNESCTIKFTIYCKHKYDEYIYDSCLIKSGETYILKRPILLIKLYKNNKFFFTITKILANEEKQNMLYNYFFTNDITYNIINTEFIYGLLTTDIRKNLVKKKCYVNIDRKYYFYHPSNGDIYEGLHSYSVFNLHLLPMKFIDSYFNFDNKPVKENINYSEEFFRLDNDWIETK